MADLTSIDIGFVKVGDEPNLRLECARIAAILMSGSDGGSAIAMVGKAELIYNYVLNGQRPNEGNQSD